MKFTLTQNTPISRVWKPKLVFTGTSTMGINPENGVILLLASDLAVTESPAEALPTPAFELARSPALSTVDTAGVHQESSTGTLTSGTRLKTRWEDPPAICVGCFTGLHTSPAESFSIYPTHTRYSAGQRCKMGCRAVCRSTSASRRSSTCLRSWPACSACPSCLRRATPSSGSTRTSRSGGALIL